MTDRTDELRDLFRDVTDAEAVTESQMDGPGTLLDATPARERIAAVVDDLRAERDLRTDLDPERLPELIAAVFDGADDEAIAADLDVSLESVRLARFDCGLVRADDFAVPDPEALAACLETGDPAACADRLGVPEEDVRRYAVARDARDRRRSGTDYAARFEAVLREADLSVRWTASARADGLREAAADIETDVSF